MKIEVKKKNMKKTLQEMFLRLQCSSTSVLKSSSSIVKLFTLLEFCSPSSFQSKSEENEESSIQLRILLTLQQFDMKLLNSSMQEISK